MKNIKKILTIGEMNRSNIIGAKVEIEKREFNQTVGETQTKKIRRTTYLKICWFCGSPYESRKYNTYACSPRCVSNIIYARHKGYNPIIKMDDLTKEKNVREVKDRLGYI